MEKVSLYIPCFNTEKFIKDCLDSVINQSYTIDEILVIDDGSIDKTAEIANNYPVRVISHKENKGVAECRNTAFKESKNGFVASLDADCVAGTLWLEQLMGCFIDDDIAGAGGRLVERHDLTLADKWRAIHMSQQWGEESLENPPFLYGSNAIFRKKVVEKLGFYNAIFKTNYEDVDLSTRIYSAGLKLIYNPKAQVEHLRKDSISSILPTYWGWQYYRHINLELINHKPRRIVARIMHMLEYTALFVKFFREDLLKKNYKLILIDFILIFYSLCKNALCFVKDFLLFEDKKCETNRKINLL